MSVLRAFSAMDMFKFNNINLDIWTETYGINFYLDYLARWPDLCCVQEAPNGRMMGYSFCSYSRPVVLGKAEGSSTEWHGHITALTVAPEYRRLSLARNMVSRLELVSDQHYKGFFVDLYVRCNNALAVSILGVGRGGRDEEDAFDMRKPLSRDPQRRSVRA
ncbi:hypothetical protein F5J12DRAFT_806376 [Pisolithus orientalis]|uniref:uncharacterized protein n=1 Tax=Pisolithus orientalis TaxID=936130 RepID=UPI002223F981|nr:uncharacterized protein F5J12DRAFT_806376 [Pisolithus orientalis]KAI6028591.1 hypothetical protein F5J12DRAFT_806376 [Pisolithus orientalis]